MSYNKVKNDYQTDYEIIFTIEKGFIMFVRPQAICPNGLAKN